MAARMAGFGQRAATPPQRGDEPMRNLRIQTIAAQVATPQRLNENNDASDHSGQHSLDARLTTRIIR